MILVTSAQSQSHSVDGHPLHFVPSLTLTLGAEQGLPTTGWKNGGTQARHRAD